MKIPAKTSGYELNIQNLNVSSISYQISRPWKLFSISVQMIINGHYEYYQTQSQSINTACIKIPGSFNLQGIHKMDPSWGLCREKATQQPHSHQGRIPETGFGILRNSWFLLHSLTHSLPHTSNKYIQCCWDQTLVLETMHWIVALFKFLSRENSSATHLPS